ncbi:NUDIX domain-containing protein [Gaoshiqia sp. Z1-71]|uniref:NUDIX domain-containing protein n=1 Tax=Gaoshiqia hydrogeniformans TaxID=3290090 RepID=UPI003BF9256A
MNHSIPSKFNIRVYGLFLNKRYEVLVTDEFQLDTRMTKFPGGGLHFGEGTIDCLIREMREECSQEIDNITHFYTTDFYQKALFYDDHQLVSIYYAATLKEPLNFRISKNRFDFDEKNGRQSFRWIPVELLEPEEFTFPIDKHVVTLLKNKSK